MRALWLAVALVLAAATHAAPSWTAENGPEPSAVQVAAATDTLPRVVRLPEVVVSTARADEKTPVARSLLSRDELQQRNWGQDVPMALAALPGVYAYSDAGNGIGYSYLSIRGFPQRRISVLINGVPLNDPQSHEVYWIDHPDLLASTAEVQVQRGVGSALYGAASVGGSVNLETSPFTDHPHAAASLGYGSYDTRRGMLELGSGELSGGWNLYGRYTRLETDGYRQLSWSRLWSYYLSARKLAGRQSFRVNLYGGPEESHLAFNGVPRTTLDGGLTGDREQDRRFNPLTYPREADRFFEPHYELIHSWSPRRGLTLSQTLFYFDGGGYFEQFKERDRLTSYRLQPWATPDSTLLPRRYYRRDAGGNLVRDTLGNVIVERADVIRQRWVENRHFGWIPRLRLEHPGGALTVGGEIRAADGRHWGEVVGGRGLPPGTAVLYRYYDYHPRTISGGLFLREEWQPAPDLLVTADAGWRHQSYLMRDDRFQGFRFDQRYNFALPRLGVTWRPRAELTLFAAWAQSGREPSFRNLLDPQRAGAVPLYRDPGTYKDPYIRPERVNDYEFGASWTGAGAAASLNLFRMDFKDEIVTSQWNTDFGRAVPANAARSVHQGVELAARAERSLANGLRAALEGNATVSDNHFVEYREAVDATTVLDNDGKAIAFFPTVLGNLQARLEWRGARLAADVQHAGRMYLDNTEQRAASIEPRTVLNLAGGYRLPWDRGPQVELLLRVFNVTDLEYEVAGYTYWDTGVRYVEFIPAAKRNVLGEVKVAF